MIPALKPAPGEIVSPTGGSAEVDLEPPGCELLVVGCGNLLRGDDGVGPVLVRQLWELGVPDGAQLVDGGTAGMDTAFRMRGAKRVVIVDASATGAAPGTVYRVPGSEFEELPPLQGLHTHSFRWDHAIAFARWALGDACPSDITVFLIEVATVEFGAELSEPVLTGMQTVMDVIERDFLAPLRPAKASEATVEFTADGYVRLDAALAASRFASDAVAAVVSDDDFLLIPLRGPRSGGLLLKQRNPAGDRSVLIHEVLYGRIPVGVRPAYWDEARGALRIPLEPGP